MANDSAGRSGDWKGVSIFFQEKMISQLFSELLEVRGVNTRILTDIAELPDNWKIITEPQYFDRLNKKAHDRCLIVGNKNSLKDLDVLCLSRPLTEDKVETAIETLLNS